MNNLLKTFSVVALLIASVANSFAGDDKKAKTILDELSKNTKSYSSITSEYTRVVKNKDNKQVENQKGKVKMKGKKFKMELSDLLIITDGTTMWTKNEGEVTIKDYEKDGELNPENIFFLYEKGYNYTLEKTLTAGGKTTYVINLTPQTKKKVENIKLYVDGSKKKIAKVEIFRTNKNVETIEINNFTPNNSIPDSEFTLDTSKYKDVVDEREDK
jgi:outer membrane lipoprotein carrier protein